MFINSNQWYKHQVTNWMNTWKNATMPGFQFTTVQFILRDWHSLPNFILKKIQWDMQYYWKWTLKELLVSIFHIEYAGTSVYSFIDSVHFKKKKKKTSPGTTENFLCTGSCEVPFRKQLITIIFQNGLLMAKIEASECEAIRQGWEQTFLATWALSPCLD